MTASRNLTPYILAGFFTAILLALVAASAWSHEQANQAAQAYAADAYAPADDDMPVTDAVIEKSTG